MLSRASRQASLEAVLKMRELLGNCAGFAPPPFRAASWMLTPPLRKASWIPVHHDACRLSSSMGGPANAIPQRVQVPAKAAVGEGGHSRNGTSDARRPMPLNAVAAGQVRGTALATADAAPAAAPATHVAAPPASPVPRVHAIFPHRVTRPFSFQWGHQFFDLARTFSLYIMMPCRLSSMRGEYRRAPSRDASRSRPRQRSVKEDISGTEQAMLDANDSTDHLPVLLDTDVRGEATRNVHARAGFPSQAVRPHWDVAAALVHASDDEVSPWARTWL